MKKLTIASLRRVIAPWPLCLITSLTIGSVSAQIITRDRMDAPTVAGNALISGTVVTDDQTPQPVRRAQITLVNTDTGYVKNGSTDASGRFSLAGLAAGRYTLAV